MALALGLPNLLRTTSRIFQGSHRVRGESHLLEQDLDPLLLLERFYAPLHSLEDIRLFRVHMPRRSLLVPDECSLP